MTKLIRAFLLLFIASGAHAACPTFAAGDTSYIAKLNQLSAGCIPTAGDASVPRAAAGGTANAITATFSPAITLADKTIVAVVAGAANSTTTPTFAPNGLTAHTITKNGNSALVAGDIAAAGHVVLLEYNLAGTRWELLNPAVSGGGSSSLTATYIGYGDGSNALTGSAELTYNATNKAFGLSASRNNDVDIGVVNTNSGTGASAVIFAQNDGGSNVAFYKLGSNYTTSGLLAANEGFVYNNTAAMLFTNSASADFIWSYGGTAATNEVARLGAGTFSLGVAGTTVGKLELNNATSGSVTIQPTTGALGSATLTLPAGASTSVIADTGASNNFLTAISAAGVISKAQPAFSNLSGSATCAQLPALTGDATTSAGACATTLATVNSNVGTFGSATKSTTQTVNAKGLTTAISEQTVTPALTSITDEQRFCVRLSLESGVPVSTTDQTAKTNIYAMPFGCKYISLWDGSKWVTVSFTETALAVGTQAALAPRDIFGYLSSGALAVEDLAWLNATVTMTIASPGVVTWVAHGMNNGDQVVLTTTGALPTGLSANTAYYLVNKATDTFQLATTQGGTAINTTGTQSGTHTGWQSKVRGTALAYTDGVYTKSGDKTRLHLGTYLTASTTTTENSAAKRYLWNRFNQQLSVMANATETTDTWTYTTATWRQANANTANQLDYVTGDASTVVAAYAAANVTNVNGNTVYTAVGVDSTTTPSGLRVPQGASVSNQATAIYGSYTGLPGAGRHKLVWLEFSGAGGTTTWYGDAGSTNFQAGINGSLWN
jgi:hypothetical protein